MKKTSINFEYRMANEMSKIKEKNYSKKKKYFFRSQCEASAISVRERERKLFIEFSLSFERRTACAISIYCWTRESEIRSLREWVALDWLECAMCSWANVNIEQVCEMCLEKSWIHLIKTFCNSTACMRVDQFTQEHVIDSYWNSRYNSILIQPRLSQLVDIILIQLSFALSPVDSHSLTILHNFIFVLSWLGVFISIPTIDRIARGTQHKSKKKKVFFKRKETS